MTELQLAEDRVPGLCDELGLSEDVQERAKGYAHRADMEHPVNRSPSVAAASCVYLASLMENEKRTQPTVADAAGVNYASIHDAYREIGRHEGIPIGKDSDEETDEESASLAERVKEALRI